jgi:light-regulated signal transduction histidine kinase (bacteriophytochrome)
MGQMVRDVLTDLAVAARRPAPVVTVADLPSANGDPALLRQVWTNLLDNAVKFSSRRETPAIEIRGSVGGNELIYSIKDNGAGFDMEYASKLFGTFQRLHSNDEFEGTGVGLAIVQRIIQRSGGRVWAESAVDQGATFFFALPAQPATSNLEP